MLTTASLSLPLLRRLRLQSWHLWLTSIDQLSIHVLNLANICKIRRLLFKLSFQIQRFLLRSVKRPWSLGPCMVGGTMIPFNLFSGEVDIQIVEKLPMDISLSVGNRRILSFFSEASHHTPRVEFLGFGLLENLIFFVKIVKNLQHGWLLLSLSFLFFDWNRLFFCFLGFVRFGSPVTEFWQEWTNSFGWTFGRSLWWVLYFDLNLYLCCLLQIFMSIVYLSLTGHLRILLISPQIRESP